MGKLCQIVAQTQKKDRKVPIISTYGEVKQGNFVLLIYPLIGHP